VSNHGLCDNMNSYVTFFMLFVSFPPRNTSGELRLAENLLVGTVPCGSLETATFLSADCENSVVECTCCTECM